ncbi:thermostable DNA polymerase I [Sphingobium phage Lacusarx]|uniref:Thermostable DNA polymerase I n=1 Tax=Sphingobium phage Lacusarx TaxID=1980139 RepID=A0A1W6DX45_9CAUD|nr:DNA polymerase I [Sphingobium phage Lacusarx]ARK07459.1 thermostable DNA polymerase I [Sphingobium phage Lacusarx]
MVASTVAAGAPRKLPDTPQVWNLRTKKYPKGDVYCGRGTPWGNPYIGGKHGSRDTVCDKFEKFVLPELDVEPLRGKHLLCWCKPLRCHCDAILKKANAPLVIKDKKIKHRILVFDAETDGLLREVTRVHCVAVRDFDTGQRWMFRQNKRENNIEKLFDLLDSAEEIWNHNLIGFDIPMLEKLYPWWTPQARIRDTMVLARLLFPDQKDKDFRLHEAGKIDGKLIGTHKLDAWGQRLNMFKGDYSKIKEAEGLELGYEKGSDEMRRHVWGKWSQELEDYCVNDVGVTCELIKLILPRLELISDEAVYVQHRLADLMARQQESGFFFNVEDGEALASDLRVERTKLEGVLDIEFPGRFIGEKRMDTAPMGRAATGGEFPDFGITEEEIEENRWWGVPKEKTKAALNYADPFRARYDAGSWFTPVKWQEFNPRSRPQITDRLQDLGWQPEDEDYTEKGNVKANDVILRRIIDRFPVAEPLADLMALNKLMGQLADGSQAWLKQVDEDGFIHAYVNPCGAVTTRATHSFPNLAQVPAIKSKKAKLDDITFDGMLTPGATVMWKGVTPAIVSKVKGDEVGLKLLGLRGGWGIESRSLFTVPEGFLLTGSDLAGIELRCLAHRMAQYDGGAYGKVLLEGDIHSENQSLAELDSRDTAKTFIYAFLYGAGDEKIGSIVNPLAPPHIQAKIGKELKARFLRNLPALNKVIRDIQRQAKRKYITGIDGRRLFVRSSHAALNTDLQGMGATIANWWLIFIEDMLNDAGLQYGWDGDYTFCAWVHDEVQIAAREGLQSEIERICIEAAAKAGEYLQFALPVEASASSGIDWSVTH